MKRLMMLCVAALLPLSAALASVPPDIPADQMPPAYRPNIPVSPLVDVPPPHPDPAGPMTFERLKKINPSGVLYKALYDEAVRNARATGALSSIPDSTMGKDKSERPFRFRGARVDAAGPVTGPVTGPTAGSRAGGPRLSVAINAFSGGTVNVSATDQAQDVEPTITSVNISGVQHTTTVVTRYENCWNNQPGETYQCPQLYAYHTTDKQNWTGPIKLSTPLNRNSRLPAWDSMGDPLLSVNVYTGGVWGKRMYLTGMLFDRVTPTTNSSAIAVWHSDNGGLGWSDASLVEIVSGGGFEADKPAIAVSWQQGASLGYVYVAYLAANGNLSQLKVARSTDGGIGFSPVTLTTDNVEFPQVVVDSQGVVTPIWVNRNSLQVQATHSNDYGVSFAGAPFELVSNQNVVAGGTVAGFAQGRGNSVPMARYNSVAGRISLVYYGHAPGATNFQVYYTYKPGCTSCNGSGWPSTPAPLTSGSGTVNYFNAALDFNKSTGNLIVPYYRSYGVWNGFAYTYYYDEYASYINASGVPQQSEFVISPASSNADNQSYWPGFIGDYQDAWDDFYAGEQVLAAWIGIGISHTTTNGDDCTTTVSY